MNSKYTVSEITELIRQNLEGSFPSLIVEGELSNFRPSSSGHLYFTLKDSSAAISCMMFKNRMGRLFFEPKDGMLLRVRGSLSVYAQRGTYSIICEEIERAGDGEILAMLEKRKQDLAREGLFDEERKKEIPRFPKTVGVVSSPSGAAVRDILNIIGRRSSGIRVVILPAPVQGNEAAPVIARRIQQANQWNLADVLIVGRGGGSLEDLLPFSEEEVVRAIAGSEIPVVSAVGHEIDWALSDFAADLRAPTPSAAAELVSTSSEETMELVIGLRDFLYDTIRSKLEKARLLIKPFSLADLEYRFRSILQPRLMRFDDAKESLVDSFKNLVSQLRHRLDLTVTALEAGSPLSVMEKGFSLVINERTSEVLRNASELKKGDRLSIRPMKGYVVAVTEEIREIMEIRE